MMGIYIRGGEQYSKVEEGGSIPFLHNWNKIIFFLNYCIIFSTNSSTSRQRKLANDYNSCFTLATGH